MARKSVEKGTPDVWQFCNQNNVIPNNAGFFNASAFVASRVIIYDNRSGGAPDTRRFLLVSPELSSKYLQRLVTLIRQEELTCGFRVHEAFASDVVYVVDPNGDFSDEALLPLVKAEIKIERVEGSEPTDLAQNLETLL